MLYSGYKPYSLKQLAPVASIQKPVAIWSYFLLPGNKPRDQLVPDPISRLLIDVIIIVRSYNGILIIVLEIIGDIFAPPRAVV